jgi:hypothetical protein
MVRATVHVRKVPCAPSPSELLHCTSPWRINPQLLGTGQTIGPLRARRNAVEGDLEDHTGGVTPGSHGVGARDAEASRYASYGHMRSTGVRLIVEENRTGHWSEDGRGDEGDDGSIIL